MTTEEELEAYHIVKAILREAVDPRRVTQRDQISYFNVLLDDTNRKPICRLHFNTTQKQIGIFDKDKKEEKIPINDLNEIYEYADRLKATLSLYE